MPVDPNWDYGNQTPDQYYGVPPTPAPTPATPLPSYMDPGSPSYSPLMRGVGYLGGAGREFLQGADATIGLIDPATGRALSRWDTTALPPSMFPSPGETGLGGYLSAGLRGAGGNAPLAIGAAALGQPEMALPLEGSGFVGGVAEHAVRENFPNAPWWVAPAVGAMAGGWGPGIAKMGRLGHILTGTAGTGSLGTALFHPLSWDAYAARDILGHTAGFFSGAGDVAAKIAAGVAGVGAMLAPSLNYIGRSIVGLPGTARNLLFPAAGALGAEAEQPITPPPRPIPGSGGQEEGQYIPVPPLARY